MGWTCRIRSKTLYYCGDNDSNRRNVWKLDESSFAKENCDLDAINISTHLDTILIRDILTTVRVHRAILFSVPNYVESKNKQSVNV